MASDIAVVWDNTKGRGDWAMAGADLASGNDLQSAICLSLFTDARAPADYQGPAPWDGRRRGHWTDTYNGYQIGSLLWTLARSVKTNRVLVLAQMYAAQAVAWLTEAGVVASFTITAQWVNRTMLGLRIVARMPSGPNQTFQFNWVWQQGVASVSQASAVLPPYLLDASGNQLLDASGNALEGAP